MNELVEVAILAYRSNRFCDAVELLLQVTAGDENNWMACLYLGMSYQLLHRTADAHRVFKRLAIACPDEHIRQRAQNIMPILDADMRQRFSREKPNNKTSDENLNESLVSLG